MKVTEGQYFHQLSHGSFENAVIIVDIDGTLTSSSSMEVDMHVRTLLRRLQERNTVYAFSNNYNGSRSRYIAQMLQLPYIEAPHKKPNTKILRYIDIGTSPVVAIGDKFLTDGLFAHFANAHHIRVQRYQCAEDTIWDRMACALDDCVYKMACMAGIVERNKYRGIKDNLSNERPI